MESEAVSNLKEVLDIICLYGISQRYAEPFAKLIAFHSFENQDLPSESS
jgi:hypothetical protein